MGYLFEPVLDTGSSSQFSSLQNTGQMSSFSFSDSSQYLQLLLCGIQSGHCQHVCLANINSSVRKHLSNLLVFSHYCPTSLMVPISHSQADLLTCSENKAGHARPRCCLSALYLQSVRTASKSSAEFVEVTGKRCIHK